MSIAIQLIMLIFAVVISNLIATKIRSIPATFIYIAAGIILSFLPWFTNYVMAPEVFLFIIISVLMFNEGQHTNIRQLVHDFGPTLSMSVWLSLITIVVVGFVTHMFMPALSLPLAFVLGAIITPTDSVAVTSITSELEVPSSVMGTLANESLFNDASGIVAFNLCILAITTGYFSVFHAVTNFLYVFGGGIVLGLLLGWLIVMTRLWMIRGRLSGPQVVIPYNILTPFIIYFIAELFGVSGILAVVAAGMVHGWQSDLLKLSSSRLQITTNSAWELLSSVLNGVVFVLLGISFPEVLNELRDHSVHNLNLLIFVGISLYIVMVLVRFLWVWFGLVKLPHEDNQSKLKDSMLIAINGIHGTITMAMAFSLPLSLNRNFNYGRADLIFISAIVIGLSLLVPAVVLKLILPAKKPSYTETELDEAKGNAINAGIDRIRHYPDSQNLKAVIQILNSQRYLAPVMDEKRVKSLLDEAKQIEQATITAMVKDNKISDSEAAQYKQMAIVMYDRYSRNIWIDYWNWIIPFSKLNRESRKLNRELKRQVRGGNKLSKAQLQAERHQWIIKMNQVQREPYEAITNYLDNLPNPFERPEIMLVRAFYDQRQRFWNRTSEEQTAQNEMLTIAFQEEYSYVQNLINNGDISSQLGNKVFDEIANDQILYMQRNDRDS